MADVVSFSGTRAYIDCPRQFWYTYVHKLEVPVQSDNLVLGELLHRSLARYLATKPSSEVSAIQIVDDVVERATDLDADMVRRVRDEAAGHLLDYHRVLPEWVGAGHVSEERIAAQFGKYRFVCRPDVVWRTNGTLTEADFKLSAPPLEMRLLQASFAHVGLRNQDREIPSIEHKIVVFNPKLTVLDVPLDEPTYRRNIDLILDVAARARRDREWRPNPKNCGRCRYAVVCETAAVTVDSIPY